jgi:hypothetical protein
MLRKLLPTMAVFALAILAVPAESAAGNSVNLMGAFSVRVLRPQNPSWCPAGVADECGVMDLDGLGKADWAYAYGPTFVPSGPRSCFNVDGTFAITLHSDGSMISGPLIGVFCSRLANIAHDHVGTLSYGNPFSEDDSIQFSGGTGQFYGLQGSAVFHQFGAGAVFQGTLNGTLGN